MSITFENAVEVTFEKDFQVDHSGTCTYYPLAKQIFIILNGCSNINYWGCYVAQSCKRIRVIAFKMTDIWQKSPNPHLLTIYNISATLRKKTNCGYHYDEYVCQMA
jgi:hypothetical protein